jgi:hypothetical protein
MKPRARIRAPQRGTTRARASPSRPSNPSWPERDDRWRR